ncbi:PhzF family phenazine biosynthesis protein [Fulvivirga kasyanovii]|uniref:PhzF family phenazine biosynthesis protein n=1 Tax=Fulvivirga kasyanovii TaxID=396812 RepID=A0ABW9RSW1_9BACT|nr:PhzF family phenazine biosynthesis protein [Fulvivirga kasyanovii]MTI27262.1 PhzF family phenazine biosynthesis protein [Fulvivirga kasyanovii]
MKISTYIIDAFTDEAFKGNPAGVCLAESQLPDKTMQAIAGELNLSETAFLLQNEQDKNVFSIRYFTPTVEIPFCGHATLASAKLVLDVLKNDQVEFVTGHALHLFAWPETGGRIKMKFPLYETVDYQTDNSLYHALGISFPVNTRFAKALDMLLIEVENKQLLESLTPDYPQLLASTDTVKEVVVTAKSDDDEYDFYSRCFCPWIGINEDPVTGAAHSVLAKYWGNLLDKKEMKAYQVSKRGGYLQLKITSDTELEVISQAHVVLEGTMHV